MYPRRKEEVAQSDSRNCALLACGGKGVYGASDTCSLGPKSPDAGRILDSPKMPELSLGTSADAALIGQPQFKGNSYLERPASQWRRDEKHQDRRRQEARDIRGCLLEVNIEASAILPRCV